MRIAADEELLTEEQASKQELPMSLSWYRRQRWLKRGPTFIRVGNRVFYPRADLRSFLNKRRVKA